MRRHLLVSCLLAAMTVPVYAHAGVQVTNTLETAWNGDNKNGPTTDQPYDDNYGVCDQPTQYRWFQRRYFNVDSR